MVDVEAGVYKRDGVVNVAPDFTAWGFGVRRRGEGPLWRVNETLVEEGGIVAGVGSGVDVGRE